MLRDEYQLKNHIRVHEHIQKRTLNENIYKTLQLIVEEMALDKA